MSEQKKTANWYEENIEAGVRDIVRLLRDNGFNTVSSCHHRMEIDCDFIEDGEVKRLHDLVYNAGYRDYTLIFKIEVQEGHICRDLLVKLPVGEGERYRRLPVHPQTPAEGR